MAERGTRLEPSVVTFGPLGRLAATALVLFPAVWMLLLGLVGVAFAGMWGIFVVPRALRDVWRPAALPPTDLTRLRDDARRAAELAARPADDDRVGDRPGQRRW